MQPNTFKPLQPSMLIPAITEVMATQNFSLEKTLGSQRDEKNFFFAFFKFKTPAKSGVDPALIRMEVTATFEFGLTGNHDDEHAKIDSCKLMLTGEGCPVDNTACTLIVEKYYTPDENEAGHFDILPALSDLRMELGHGWLAVAESQNNIRKIRNSQTYTPKSNKP